MIIEKFLAPADEVSDVGLKEINMSRIGRFVALAGKNGAGKSRILKKLENIVNYRNDSLQEVPKLQQTINFKQAIINQYSNSPERSTLEIQLQNLQRQKSQIENRIILGENSDNFKIIRFVPKGLNLLDPSEFTTQELFSRHSQAKQPDLYEFEQKCLFYIQMLQNEWWNATHPNYPGTPEDKDKVLSDYERLKQIITDLLGIELKRNIDGIPTMFDKPIIQAGLSDGQKIILQLCVALHAQHSELDNTVFLLDEPENHLHPSAAIDLLKMLYEKTERSQFWIATHSVPLLAYIASIDPMSLWYVENGSVTNAGRHPEMVLESLLGDEQQIGHLNAFTGLPAQLATVNYTTECLFPPKVISNGENDPQINQIQNIINNLAKEKPLRVLDYGAGKGRLLDGLAASIEASQTLTERLDYFAFDPDNKDKDFCQKVINANFSDTNIRYFNSREDFFSHKNDGSIDVVVMCNVFHEISPSEWPNLFSQQSLIIRALQNDGYMLLVEDQRIPVGEKAHKYGFIIPDTSHLRTLFKIKSEDNDNGRFSVNDARKNGRLKAHLISKSLLMQLTSETVKQSIDQLRQTAKDKIKHLRDENPTYSNGQLYGFWMQQFANATLFLD